MRKRLILAVLGMMALLVGLATFAANTAQWVNVEARVEKEIEIACVVRDSSVQGGYSVDEDGCDFGVVVPENRHEQLIEVTLSNSFLNNQDVKSSVLYWVLWECKQYADGRDVDGDTIPDCRVDAEHDEDDLEHDGDKWQHVNEELDGAIRDYMIVDPSDATCLSEYTGPDFDVKYIEPVVLGDPDLGDGVVSFAKPKCIYDLIFLPPACEGHWNPQTDPGADPTEIDCHEMVDDPDPQLWDRFAEIGDDFKIQVYDFGVE